MRRLVSLWQHSVSLLFPAVCVGCKAFLKNSVHPGVCTVCDAGWEDNNGTRCEVCDIPVHAVKRCVECVQKNPAFDSLRAPWLYGGTLAHMVQACKFGPHEGHAQVLGRRLAHRVLKNPAWGSCTVQPVPLSRLSRYERGFNQSAVMALEITRVWGVPVLRTLTRVRETGRQSLLNKEQRQTNMQGAFVSKPISGTVVLVDDVVTTGSTVHEAAQALKQAGAQGVHVLALARVE
jgi:ComF family protein